MKNYFLLGIISLILIAGTSEVYGHGLGSVESESIKIGNDYLKVKVETNPDVLKGDEDEIDFSVTRNQKLDSICKLNVRDLTF